MILSLQVSGLIRKRTSLGASTPSWGHAAVQLLQLKHKFIADMVGVFSIRYSQLKG